MSLAIEKTVSDIAVEHPASLRIFEQLGIDYCCGGKKPLAEVCTKLGLSVDDVLRRIEKAEAATAVEEVDWKTASLTSLCRHIVTKHHTYVRTELERLDKIVNKVVAVHGAGHPELFTIRDYFQDLNTDMTSHMFKEEHVLFPYVEKLEQAATGAELPPACFTSVQQPITAMMNEHDIAGSLLAQMRTITHGYVLPEGACVTYGAMYEGLQDFERDLHQHVHLENNILFPAALRLEEKMRR
jgi:regulator of cell morphogenesis and NO signaling